MAGAPIERLPNPGEAGDQTRHDVGRLSLLAFFASALDRVSAFLLVAVIAALFGASHQSDLYFLALVIPTAVGGALSDAFYTIHVPIFSRQEDGHFSLDASLCRAAFLAAALTLAYTGILLAVNPDAILVWLIFAPLLFVMPVSGVYAAFFVAAHRYVMASMRLPAATVIALALVCGVLPLWRSAASLAASMVAGNIAVLAVLAWRARTMDRTRPINRSSAYSYRRMLGSTLSAFGAIIIGGPLVVVLERALASTLATGTIALLTFSRNLALVPALIPTALASGVFPAAAGHHAHGEPKQFASLMLKSIRISALVALISTSFVIVCRVEIVKIALQRGALNQAQAHTVARLLVIVSWSLIGISLLVLTTRGFFAMRRYRLIAWLSAGSLVLYCATAAFLRWQFGIDGLALAFSVSLVATGIASGALLGRTLALSVRQTLVEWLVAPTLLALAFAGGAYGGRVIVATSSRPTTWQALEALLFSFLAGTTALALTVSFLRTKEYIALRNLRLRPARESAR